MRIINHLTGYIVSSLVLATSAMAGKISRIEFVGCNRVEPETVEAYMGIRVGDESDASAINQSIRSLNATGLFEKVDIAIKGTVLVVTVKEYPVINKIQFEGNSKLSDQKIKDFIHLKEREILSPTRTKEIQQMLLEVYRQMGRYNATINPKIIKLDNNRVNLVFEVNEGKSASIGRIVFIGNEHFASSALRDVIYSRVKRWYRLFVKDDVYSAARMEEDKNAIIRHYTNNGYADVRVTSAVAELARNKKEFTLTFVIDEGRLYRFGKVGIKSNIAKLPEKSVKVDFECRKGGKFSREFLTIDTAAIAKKASDCGYSAVSVNPKITKNNDGTADVLFTISECPRVYVSRIVTKGNSRTRDHVIRREFELEEGDVYSQALAARTENKIRNLGHFSSVSVDQVPDPSAGDKCILQATVEEMSTAQITFGGSWSSLTGLGLNLGYGEGNFLGYGKSLNVNLNSGKTAVGRGWEIDENGKEKIKKRKSKFRFLNDVSVSMSDPRLFETNVHGSIGALYGHGGGGFESISTRELGGHLGISYALARGFSQSWRYALTRRKFDQISGTASPVVKFQAMRKDSTKPGGLSTVRGTMCNLSAVSHTVSYGKAFLVGPKGNFHTSVTTEFAGLGGHARHVKNEASVGYELPVTRKSNLSFNLSGSMITKAGHDKPNIIDCLTLGGDSLRGFDVCGVGPTAETTRLKVKTEQEREECLKNGKGKCQAVRETIGATRQWTFTIEYGFPMGLPEELGLRGFVFTDFGTCWSPPEDGKGFIKETNEDFEILGAKEDGKFKRMECEFDGTLVRHKIFDSKKVRASVGVGMSFTTPIGPLYIAWGVPIRKEKFDRKYRFMIGLTTSY